MTITKRGVPVVEIVRKTDDSARKRVFGVLRDPFDRLIIATALSDDLTVISRDAQFRKYKGLRVIW